MGVIAVGVLCASLLCCFTVLIYLKRKGEYAIAMNDTPSSFEMSDQGRSLNPMTRSSESRSVTSRNSSIDRAIETAPIYSESSSIGEAHNPTAVSIPVSPFDLFVSDSRPAEDCSIPRKIYI